MPLRIDMIRKALEGAEKPLRAGEILKRIHTLYPGVVDVAHPRSQVRAGLQNYSSDSRRWYGREDFFHRVSKGLWKLREETTSRDETESSGLVQGFEPDAVKRALIEKRAMTLACEWLEANGFEWEDRSRIDCYDLRATHTTSGDVIKVEVKGTRLNIPDTILMTANEVQLHKTEKGKTGLIIVSGIRLLDNRGQTDVVDGTVNSELFWDILKWELTPLSYKVSRSRSIPDST